MIRRRTVFVWTAAFLILSFFIMPSAFADLINDGSFENTPSSWEQYFQSACAVPAIGNWSTLPGAPPNFDGQQSLWLGGSCTNGIVRNNGARQTLDLAPDAALLSFWFNPIVGGPDPQNNDQIVAAIDQDSVWSLNVDGINTPTGWNNVIVDINQFADQTISLSFEMQHDNDNDFVSIFLDYVEILHPAITVNQEITTSPVLPGESFTVDITLENSGDILLENIATANTTFNSCSRSAGSLPDLAPGATFTYSCTIPSAVENMENDITASATATEIAYPVVASQNIVVPLTNLMLSIEVSPDDVSVTEGDSILLSVSITNNGNAGLTNVQVATTPNIGCTFELNSLAAGQTAVFNCNHSPEENSTITFTASATEPTTSNETTAETAVSIEVLPFTPPTGPVFTQFLPAVTTNFINHDELGESNDTCEQAYPISINQTVDLLAEDINDWYRFELNNNDDLTIQLNNFKPIAGQIILWRGNCQNLDLIGQNGDFALQKSISATNQPAGTYYIWLINDGPLNQTDKYSLAILTP